jgi:hypothetical protein
VRATQAHILEPIFLAFLAEALAHIGAIPEGLKVLAEALEIADDLRILLAAAGSGL